MGGDGKWWDGGKGGGKKHGRKHAFKVLCPDNLITLMMGRGGSAKGQLEEETGCRIIFSNREEFFPGTSLRTLCVYGDDPESIMTVLERMVDIVVMGGEQELQGPVKGEPEFLGKEEGTFLMRVAVSVRMAGAIIGPKGTNIQAMRDESGGALTVDKNNHAGHQLIKIMAHPDGLKIALRRLNEYVQNDSGTEEFAMWAAIRIFAEDPYAAKGWEKGEKGGKAWEKGGKAWEKGGKAWEKGKEQEKGFEKGWEKGFEKSGKGKGKAKAPHTGKGALPDYPAQEAGGRERERSPRRGQWAASQAQAGGWKEEGDGTFGGSSPSGAAQPDIEAGMLQALAATAEEFPEGALFMEYTLTCELPSSKVTALIGKGGDHIEEVKSSTGTNIHFDEDPGGEDAQQTMVVKGPLLQVYRAHALMMKRYHDVEKPAPPPEEPDVETLKAQLADLQRQLAEATGTKPDSGGANGGFGGFIKGKGKAKGKSKKG